MINWIKSHSKELIVSALLVGLMVAMVPVLRWLDPSSGILDAGFAQLLALGCLKYLLAVILAWGSGMRLLFPSAARYAESGQLASDFRDNENFRKVALTVGLALACFVLALWALNASFS